MPTARIIKRLLYRLRVPANKPLMPLRPSGTKNNGPSQHAVAKKDAITEANADNFSFISF